jgi:hypothetical protein
VVVEIETPTFLENYLRLSESSGEGVLEVITIVFS